MVVGYLLAWATGMPSAPATAQPLIVVPTPLYYGLGFDWNLLVPLMLVFMVTSIETIGDITATSDVRIVSRERLNRRAIMIIALSLAIGLGVSQQPLILQFAPQWLKTLLSSGISPWRPQAGYPLGRQARFQLSARSLTLNGVPAQNGPG